VSKTSFFGSFLDGFTGAGLARKLSAPGEPVFGFAPASGTLAQITLADLRHGSPRMYFGSGEVPNRVLEIRLDVNSGQLIMETESVSGEVQQLPIEGSPLPAHLSSVLHRQAT
jgi:hypothetical protein